MKRSAISCDLCVEGFPDERAPLDFRFALFDLGHDPVNVLQLVASLPEDFWIFHNFFLRFSLDFFGDVLDVVAPVLLVQADELVEVALAPVRETLEESKPIYKLTFYYGENM